VKHSRLSRLLLIPTCVCALAVVAGAQRPKQRNAPSELTPLEQVRQMPPTTAPTAPVEPDASARQIENMKARTKQEASASQPAKPAAKRPASPPPTEASGQARRAPTPAEAPKVAFEKFTLPNGLQVILHVDRKLPIVHVNQWYHVGSKNEKPGRTGFAHLFEHMMFQGSKHAPDEYFSMAERAGANLREGGVNGTTDFDRTNYFATVPSGNLENLLWLESDRLATLLDVTDKKKLDNQRDVVKNERRQGLENQPYGRWFMLAFEGAFPSGHPYSWPVIGSQEDLTAASLEDVQEFFRRYYTPNNLSLVVAGDFDPAEAKRLVENYFGPIAPGPALDRPTRWIPTLTREKVFEVADRVSQDRTYMAWVGPEYFSPDDAALNLTARILTDGLSARLTKTLVYDRQLCSSVNAFPVSAEIAGMFVIVVTARPGMALPQIESVVTDEIAKLAKTGPTASELERVKTKQEFDFVSGLERIGGFGGKADLLNKYNTYLGDPGKFEEDLARFRRVTLADVRNAVDRWLNTRNRVLVRFRPEGSSRPSQTTLDRSKAPALGEDRPFRVPDVQRAALDNGLELYVVERTDLPKIAVSLVARAGAMTDPADKAGLAVMLGRTINLGTKTRQALEIENALGDLGTTLNAATGRQIATLSFEVLSRHVGAALGIMADVVQHASFPDAEVAREKKRQLDALAQQDKSPDAVAARVRAILAFGADHPYGRPAQGTTRSIESLTREDLIRFHRDYWKPGGAALIVVGDTTLAEATKLARQHFGAWSGGAPPDVPVPAPKPAASGRIYLIDRQDAAQTVVTQFMPAPKRQTEDAYPLRLADAVWGGGFGTRLNLNLREDKGYSYGVFSSLVQFREAGLWYAGGGVQTNKTTESVAEFDKELKALAGGTPISQEEFASARQRRTRGYAQEFESYSRIAGKIADLWSQGLPMSEIQREYEETGKATLAAVLAAANKYAKPERATLLLVGDRSKIEAGLRDLNVGEIVLLDVNGQPAGAPARPTAQPED
jgi:zinc protease